MRTSTRNRRRTDLSPSVRPRAATSAARRYRRGPGYGSAGTGRWGNAACWFAASNDR